MKKAILSLGLFSMMMLFTSFTTTELGTVSQKLDQTETGGKMWGGKDPIKKPDYASSEQSELADIKLNNESFKILYSSIDIKKMD